MTSISSDDDSNIEEWIQNVRETAHLEQRDRKQHHQQKHQQQLEEIRRARERKVRQAQKKTQEERQARQEHERLRRQREEHVRHQHAQLASIQSQRQVFFAWLFLVREKKTLERRRLIKLSETRRALVADYREATEREYLETLHMVKQCFLIWRKKTVVAPEAYQKAALFCYWKRLQRTLIAWSRHATQQADTRRTTLEETAQSWYYGRLLQRHFVLWSSLYARRGRRTQMDNLLARLVSNPPSLPPPAISATAAATATAEEAATEAKQNKKKKQVVPSSRLTGEMADRARERQRRKELLQRRKEHAQEEKDRLEREKQQIDAEVDRQRRQQARRRQRAQEEEDAALGQTKWRLAVLHHHFATVRYRGWRPWQVLVERSRLRIWHADQFYRKRASRGIFETWRWLTRARLQTKQQRQRLMEQQACQFWQRHCQQRVLRALVCNVQEIRCQLVTAAMHHLRQLMRSWYQIAQEQRLARDLRLREVGTAYGDQALLKRLFLKWRVHQRWCTNERRKAALVAQRLLRIKTNEQNSKSTIPRKPLLRVGETGREPPKSIAKALAFTASDLEL